MLNQSTYLQYHPICDSTAFRGTDAGGIKYQDDKQQRENITAMLGASKAAWCAHGTVQVFIYQFECYRLGGYASAFRSY
jgi:hypothetical protein